MKIEVLYFDGCPNHKPAVERIQELLREQGISAEVLEVNVIDTAIAQKLGFLGSPSIRVNGLDVERAARSARDFGMMCRTYLIDGRRQGLPSREMVRQAILDANSGTRRRSAVALLQPGIARDGEEFAVRSNGGDWLTSWHSPIKAPAGTPHGANAFCVTADDGVVLISNDGKRWGWPGGRPEGDETWEQTLRREILEEACATVRDARLIGFSRGVCLSGPEEDLVLVRSVWRAEVELMAWEPRFEIAHRQVVPAADLQSHLWMEEGFEPIYRRALTDAGLISRDDNEYV